MGKMVVKINESGVRKFLKGPEIMADLTARGARAARAAGAGFESVAQVDGKAYPGGRAVGATARTARVVVRTIPLRSEPTGRRRMAEDPGLLIKALGAMR